VRPSPVGVARPDRRVAAALAGLLLAGSLAACSDPTASDPVDDPLADVPSADEGGADDGGRAGTTSVGRYAALGDSFTAAPYVPTTDFADGCFRSSGNYPALVAAALDAELVDVSCSGAATRDVTRPQAVGFGTNRTMVDPQIEAVAPDTDLVSIGIGGNDEALFSTIVRQCTSLADQPGAPCADRIRADWGDTSGVVGTIGDRVGRVLEALRGAAPEALVVLVGYPRLVDADGACRLMPLADGDVGELVRLERELNAELRSTARRAGAGFVDLHGASRGHEVCSDDPWVNGIRTDQERALAFHPFAEGQQAVADALLDVVADRRPR
jgi:lysophospholipase L1-like esterase